MRYRDGRALPGIVRALDLLSAATCVALLAFAAWAWPHLPRVVPIHFGASGNPDGWGDRAWLLVTVGFAAGTFWLLTALARHRDLHGSVITSSSEPAERDRQFFLAVRTFGWLKLTTVTVFAYVFVSTVASAQGGSGGLGSWFLPVTLAAFFGIIVSHVVAAVRRR
jgi:hypothetical protein